MEIRFTRARQCCNLVRQQPKCTPRVFIASISQQSTQTPLTPPHTRRSNAAIPTRHILPIRRLAGDVASKRPQTSSSDLTAIHHRVESLFASIFEDSDKALPSEQRVLYVLEQTEQIAQSLSSEEKHSSFDRQRRGQDLPKSKPSATSVLLGSVNLRTSSSPITAASILAAISTRAEAVLRDPTIFITPAILKTYVSLQSLLSQPASFPDIFHLYAHKPIPTKSSPTAATTFTPSSPDKINAAIDHKTASLALEAAIATHDLTLAIDIINTTFSTPAFKRAKTLRRAAIPISGLALAPAAAYALSQTFSRLQSSMDEGLASGIAFAGIMAYMSAVSMVGYVAVTTANDQMDRVTWATGVPLWERWVREEERAAIDAVAGAWGFVNVEKRGEEEGEEWESLREWIGMRGMVLDKVGLMEGME